LNVLKELFIINLKDTLWCEVLKSEIQKDYYIKLKAFLESEYINKVIYPPKNNIFNALKFTEPTNVKIVILGQDPYHSKNKANGLAFSVNSGIKPPPSLNNIYKEIKNSLNVDFDTNNGNLASFAKQGVLLLNTVLTVEENTPNSHKNIGWERFTDRIIDIVNNQDSPCVFMLWGSHAQKKKELITNNSHLVLMSSHPSPLSSYRGFLGCNHFKLADNFLRKNGLTPIDFTI